MIVPRKDKAVEDLAIRGQRAFSCSVDYTENWDMEEKQYVRLLRGEVVGSWETKKFISLVKAAGLGDVLDV